MIFIGEKDHFESLSGFNSGISFFSAECLEEDWETIYERIKAGEHFIFASQKNLELLNRLWIFSVDGEITENAFVKYLPPDICGDVSFSRSKAKYLFIRSFSTYAMHGIDEEPRADIFPFVVDRDKYGREKGAVGLAVKNYDSALTSGNYKGAWWYVIAADPFNIDRRFWESLITHAVALEKEKCYVSRLVSEFPVYSEGERIRIDFQVENLSDELKALAVEIKAVCGDKNETVAFRQIAVTPRSTENCHVTWYPDNTAFTGTVRLEAVLYRYDRFVYGEARENGGIIIDSLSRSVMIKKAGRTRPNVIMSGKDIVIDGERGFFMGTHYYPSSDFYELSYRDVNLSRAEETIGAMKNAGIRICRIWCDPILDETSLRGMEAIVELLADAGIVAWITIFTSWVHTMEVNTEKYHARFDAADQYDERLIGLIFKGMPEQKLFVRALAEHFQGYTNIVWDLSNEFSVVDPTPEQAGYDWVDKSSFELPPPFNSIALFRQWAEQIRSVLTCTDPTRPVVYGVSCWDTGSENYRCTENADIVVEHTYHPKEQARYYANFSDPTCIGKSHVIEEFGGTWTDSVVRAEEYDSRFHSFIASTSDAAMSYEWGSSWLCDRLSGVPPFMKFMNDYPAECERFFFAGRYTYAESWPRGCVSICPWVASHMYAINFPNNDYETPAILVTKRFSQIGAKLVSRPVGSGTYLVLPFETEEFKPQLGYQRKTDYIKRCFDALWRCGAEFDIWQSDKLGDLPADAKIVLYPAEKPIPADTEKLLSGLEAKGVRVMRGDVSGLVPGADIPHAVFRSDKDCMVQVRNTEYGKLYVLHSDSAERVKVEFDGTAIEFTGDGLLMQGDRISIAEFSGSFSCRGFRALSENKVAVTACGPFRSADMLTVLPFREGHAVFDGFTRCEIRNDSGENVDCFGIFGGRIEIAPGLETYTYVLSR
ncbi:MAG: hypothetical protein J5563_05875 [Clostridia bacterium]|nr:hypothetical protein [Clostridia bacterium]